MVDWDKVVFISKSWYPMGPETIACIRVGTWKIKDSIGGSWWLSEEQITKNYEIEVSTLNRKKAKKVLGLI